MFDKIDTIRFKITKVLLTVAHAESGVGTGRKNRYHFLADAFPAGYPCKECGENVPGYAVGGGSSAGRGAEGELNPLRVTKVVMNAKL